MKFLVLIFSTFTIILLSSCGSDKTITSGCDEIYSMAREMPVIQDGIASIQEKIRYTNEARSNQIEGAIEVSFIVNKKGRVLEPRVTKGLGYGLDEEALRIIKLARFNPASQSPGGNPVCVRFALPINFLIPR